MSVYKCTWSSITALLGPFFSDLLTFYFPHETHSFLHLVSSHLAPSPRYFTILKPFDPQHRSTLIESGKEASSRFLWCLWVLFAPSGTTNRLLFGTSLSRISTDGPRRTDDRISSVMWRRPVCNRLLGFSHSTFHSRVLFWTNSEANSYFQKLNLLLIHHWIYNFL